MTTPVEALLPAHERARRGEWSPWQAAPPVTASDIRRWALAVYWPEPPPTRFLDEAVARAGPWGGLVAPQEMNPFAWSGPPARATATAGHPQAPGARRVLGGCRIRFGAAMRPGDVVRRRRRLDGWTPKASAGGGELLLVDHTHEWWNQRDEEVRSAVYTLVYQPADGGPR